MKNGAILILILMMMSCESLEEGDCPSSGGVIDVTIINQTQDGLIIQATYSTCYQIGKGRTGQRSVTDHLIILAGETKQDTWGSSGSLELSLHDSSLSNVYAHYYPNLSDDHVTLYVKFDGTDYSFEP